MKPLKIGFKLAPAALAHFAKCAVRYLPFSIERKVPAEQVKGEAIEESTQPI